MNQRDEAAMESMETPETTDTKAEPVEGESAAEEAAPPGPDAAEPGVAEIRAEMAALGTALDASRKELSQVRERHLRMAAEYDNYRKRTERERTEAWGRAQAEVVGRLLDALDDLERVAHFDESTSAAALLEGVQLVDKKLRQILEAAGLELVDAGGKIFDPNTMEGLATVEAESPEEDDRVSDVFQKGYLFKGQLLRPARVRVKQYEG